MSGRNSISKNKDYNTPPHILKAVREFFGGNIELDPCSNQFSMVGARVEWMLPTTDGLVQDWTPFRSIFVNPPYGKDRARGTSIYNWCSKAAETHDANSGCHVLMLIPVATNTRHWKEIVFRKATHICFLSDTRLKFWENGKENKNGAPMACAIVHFGKRGVLKNGVGVSFEDAFSQLGFNINLCERGGQGELFL